METPYSRIAEVKEAPSPEEANELLREGFKLIKVMEKYTSDPNRQFSNIVYVLGRHKFNGESRATAEQTSSPNKQSTALPVDSAVLENLPWKKYSNGGGEWTFYMDRDEILLPELAGARELIERLKVGEEIVVGNYKYRIKDKFMKRFPADGTKE